MIMALATGGPGVVLQPAAEGEADDSPQHGRGVQPPDRRD